MLPDDPMMLLSVINTKLRDEFESLDELCDALDESKDDICAKLTAAGYQYAHDTAEKLTNMQCLPDSLLGREYYQPTTQGLEERFKTRLEQIKDWKKKNSG